MKNDKVAGGVMDPNSVLKKHLSAAQRRKRRKLTTIIVVTALALIAIAVVVIQLRNSVADRFASDNSGVQSASVTVGSISTTISGTGTLADDDVEDIEIPADVKLKEVRVEEGDTVAEGDMIAVVDTASVISAMADVQDQLDDVDEQLKDVSDETVSSKITAGLSGRVKKIFAQKGDDVATVMYENGALMLISLDGLMAADIETDAEVAAGDTVTVTLSDGTELEGTVQSTGNAKVTVTVTDNGTVYGDTVKVSTSGGSALGSGTLYIHSELKVTGYAGTISKVRISENQKVSASTTVITLTDTSYTANYDTLLKQRTSLEDEMGELIKLYKEGAVCSPIAGTVSSVDYDEDGDDAASSDSAAGGAEGMADAQSVAGEDSSDDNITVATVCPNATMSVAVNIDELDILSLEVGQEATVNIDSIGDEEFTGTVTEINKTGTSSGGVTVFTVEVTIDKTEDMLAGMSATVEIKIAGVENALLIPEDALQQTRSTSYVYTEYDEESGELGGMIEVTAGLSNGTYVEIRSGLSEGDTVYYEASSDEDFDGFMPGGFMPGGEGGSMPNMPGGGNMPSMPGGSGNQSGGMPGGR